MTVFIVHGRGHVSYVTMCKSLLPVKGGQLSITMHKPTLESSLQSYLDLNIRGTVGRFVILHQNLIPFTSGLQSPLYLFCVRIAWMLSNERPYINVLQLFYQSVNTW